MNAGLEPAIRKLLLDGGIDFRENSSSFVISTCPRCAKSNKVAMYKVTGRFVCYHCRGSTNFQGRPEWLLAELLNKTITELRKILYDDDLGYMPGRLEIELEDRWEEDEDGTLSLDIVVAPTEIPYPPDYIGMDQQAAFIKGARYLYSRGLNAEHVRTYDIRYSPIDRRVVFPVKIDDKVIGWQARYTGPTRVWNETKNKYYNIPKVITSTSLSGKGGRWLMFQDRLKGSEHCVLSEGPITAIHAHKCGGNVAAMGKLITPFQLDTIRKHVKKLYIALDPDAGIEIAKLAYDMYDELEIYLLQPPQNYLNLDDPENEKDLGDYGEDFVYDLFKQAKPEPRGRLYISLGSVLVM